MSDYVIKQGDTAPSFKVQLQAQDENDPSGPRRAIPLSGATVDFICTHINDPSVGFTQQATIVDAETGIVEFRPVASSFDVVGDYIVTWRARFGDGSQVSFPKQGHQQMTIEASYNTQAAAPMVTMGADYSNVIVVPTSEGLSHVPIQTALDEAASSTGSGKTVLIPRGEWILGQPLNVGNVSLVGEGPQHPDLSTPGVGSAPHTYLRGDDPTQPLIVTQGSRGVRLANLNLEGVNDIYGAVPGFASGFDDLVRDDIWLNNGATLDHVGIAIDPAAGSTSSNMRIYNCSFNELAGGIDVSTSGDAATQNCEDGIIAGCRFKQCGPATLRFGQDQTKAWSVDNVFADVQQCFLDTINYGRFPAARGGYTPTLSKITIGITQRIFNVDCAVAPLLVEGLYAESFLSLGNFGPTAASGAQAAIFEACEFRVYRVGTLGVLDTFLINHGKVLFLACSFRHNDPGDGGPVNAMRFHNGKRVTFDHCSFGDRGHNDVAPLSVMTPSTVHMRGTSWRNNGGSQVDFPDGALGHSTLDLGTLTLTPGADAETILVDGTGFASLDLVRGDRIIPNDASFVAKTYPTDYNIATLCSIGVVDAITDTQLTLKRAPQSYWASLDVLGSSRPIQRRRLTV